MTIEVIDIEGEIVHETEQAYLVRYEDTKEVWLPKSQTEFDGKKTFTIPVWLAEEKELV